MGDAKRGVVYALLAYGFWGINPIYFKWVEFASPGEILAHRIVWSTAILILLLTVRAQWRTLISLSRRSVFWLCVSACLLTLNWGVYIWALQNGRIIETSLGYYINPLVSVLLGMVFLGERLRPAQILALFFAAAGVVNEVVAVGGLPMVALALAFSFGLYGLVRKKIAVDSAVGLGVESAVLLPFAVAWLIYISAMTPQTTTGLDQPGLLLLLGLGGVVTVWPLIFFTAAALRLSLTSLGFFQYISPTIALFVAYTVYDSPVGDQQWISFSMIWSGLVIYSFEGLRHQRRSAALRAA